MAIPVGRVMRSGLYVGAALLLLNFVRIQLPSVGAQTIPPYTAVLSERTTNAKGESKVASTQTWAVRADGARAVKLGAEGRGSRMIEYPDGIQVMTNDETRAKSTVQKKPLARRATPPNACRPGEEHASAGQGSLVGIRVAKYRRKTDDRTATSSYALDYACQMIGQVLEFGGGERSETSLVSFTPGPPRADLFDVPADYKEGPPSALPRAEEKQVCGAACQAQWHQRDLEYYSLRPKR